MTLTVDWAVKPQHKQKLRLLLIGNYCYRESLETGIKTLFEHPTEIFQIATIFSVTLLQTAQCLGVSDEYSFLRQELSYPS